MSKSERWPLKIDKLNVADRQEDRLCGRVLFSDGRDYVYAAKDYCVDLYVEDRNGVWRSFWSSKRQHLIEDWLYNKTHDLPLKPERAEAEAIQPISVYGC